MAARKKRAASLGHKNHELKISPKRKKQKTTTRNTDESRNRRQLIQLTQ